MGWSVGEQVRINTDGRLKWADGKTGFVKEVFPDRGWSVDHLIYDEIVLVVEGMDVSKPPYGLVTVGEFEIEPFPSAKAEAGETKGTDDPVNHPSHYTDGRYECIDYIESKRYHKDGYLFNAVKYISRAGKKDPAKYKEDIEKAIWYLERKTKYGDTAKPFISTSDYIQDKGLEGKLPGLALKLIESEKYSLAVEVLRMELNTHEEHSS